MEFVTSLLNNAEINNYVTNGIVAFGVYYFYDNFIKDNNQTKVVFSKENSDNKKYILELLRQNESKFEDIYNKLFSLEMYIKKIESQTINLSKNINRNFSKINTSLGSFSEIEFKQHVCKIQKSIQYLEDSLTIPYDSE